MSQMSSADQAIIKALPGNDRCMECGMKSPQWASVSFGTVFCLECSGVHRSLGVHISFVRSIAMDSWNDSQLNLMKAGGNGKCASYLSKNGILPSTPIKAKYESPVAQHYKEMLKAKANGQPEPPMRAAPVSKSTNLSSSSSNRTPAGEDPNGMERLTGETDEQYIARQTRLRNEAKARMAAKFGSSGSMGGVGSGGFGRKPMGGVGSDSSYNPNTGGYGGGGGVNLDVDSIVSGFGSAFSTLGAFGRSGVQSASAVLQDQERMNQFAGSVKSTGSSFWNSLSSAANDIAKTITEPDEGGDDGLSGLRAHVENERMNKGRTSSSYEGFGSDNWSSGPNNSNGNAMAASNVNFASKPNGSSFNRPTTNTNVMGTNAAKLKKDMSNDDFFSSFGA